MKLVSSIRLRMIAAFLLVAVPPMFFVAYIAAKLLSDAFDRTVYQALSETANFVVMEVNELMREAEQASAVLADRLSQPLNSKQAANLGSDVALMTSLGVDIVAVYNEKNELLYSSVPLENLTPLPNESARALFELTIEGRSQIAAGAIHTFTAENDIRRAFIGYWLNDAFLSVSEAVTYLEFEIFLKIDDQFVPLLNERSVKRVMPPSLEIIQELNASSEPDHYVAGDKSIYRAIYAGSKASSDQLIGIIFVGFTGEESLFEQIGRWHLFSGIFLLGSAICIIAGLVMSGLLVKPLRALTEGVRSVSAGDFKKRVPVGGGAEIEELATSFNTMAAELERLRTIEAELRAREKLSALGEAAAVIAHEVRNPLGIIKTSSELVRNRANLNHDEKRVMGYITEEVDRIERLVHNFLDFANPKPPIKTPIQLKQIVERIADVVAPEFGRRDIKFNIHDESSSCEIIGDADQIYQVCLNLILNSMDALNGSGAIEARIRKMENEIVLAIRDNGPGVPSEIAERIFNPFFTTKAKGIGLGLAKVQGVMNAHGGRVIYSAAEGGGAQFDLFFPRAES
jgi:nitrogen fixation/metabolism regulation signal transduction histidine kinase